ncbi:protein-domain-containing protein [Hyaloraphidium curvatum]|nr:protein-domain-containing protein [Hyaloraphidium curvatum]
MALYDAPRSMLFDFQPIDAVDESERSAQGCWQQLRPRVLGKPDGLVSGSLAQIVADVGGAEAGTCGLVYGALVDNDLDVHVALNWASLVVRDNYRSIVDFLRYLLSSRRFDKVHVDVRLKTLAVLRSIVGQGIAGADALVVLAIRQVPAGDPTESSEIYAAATIDFLRDVFALADVTPYHVTVVPVAFYAVASMAKDHVKKEGLLRREVDLLNFFLQRHFQFVRRLGRELPRLVRDLQGVSIPEAADMWRRLASPEDPSSPSTGLAELLRLRTYREVYLSRISPDLESKIRFLLTQANIRLAEPKRYNILWLQRKFFPSAEHRNVVVDIVRYVVAMFHPSNEILRAEVVQRWQLITFIALCTDDARLVASIRSALLWDWIAYNRATDTVMHIEPAILMMFHNAAQYTNLLVREVVSHLIGIASLVQGSSTESIHRALRDVVRSGVLSFDELESLQKCLSANEADTWAGWLSAMQALPDGDGVPDHVLNGDADMDLDGPMQPSEPPTNAEEADRVWDDALVNLAEAMGSRDAEGSRHLLETILGNDLLGNSEAALNQLADLIHSLVDDQLDDYVTSMDTRTALELTSSPAGLVVSALLGAETPTQKGNAARLFPVLRQESALVGAAVLLHLTFLQPSATDLWRMFLTSMAPTVGPKAILGELEEVHERNLQAFYLCVVALLAHAKEPDVAMELRGEALVHRLVSLIDPKTLHYLFSKLSMGEVQLFDDGRSIASMTRTSLSWDSYEQRCFWELVRCDLLDRQKEIEQLVEQLTDMDWGANIEVSEGVLLLLQNSKPSTAVVRAVLGSPCPEAALDGVSPDAAVPFQILAVKQWCRNFPKSFVEVLTGLLQEGVKAAEAERAEAAAIPELGSGARRQSKEMALLENVLANLVLWRSMAQRLGFRDPVLSNEGVRTALQPLLSEESFYTKYQRLVVALAPRAE